MPTAASVQTLCSSWCLFSYFISHHFPPKRRSMKLLVFVIVSLFVLSTTSGRVKRGRFRCGPVTDACVNQLDGGKCPKVPFCPGNVKRVLTSEGCCCSAGNVMQVTGEKLRDRQQQIMTKELFRAAKWIWSRKSKISQWIARHNRNYLHQSSTWHRRSSQVRK